MSHFSQTHVNEVEENKALSKPPLKRYTMDKTLSQERETNGIW